MPRAPGRVLIAGAGYVGAALASRLVARGERVVALRRRAVAPCPGVEVVAADLGAPETLGALPADVDRVVFAAAPDTSSVEAYRATYVDGLRHLLEALPSPRRLVFVSSTAVFAERDGGVVDEDAALTTEGTGCVLVEAEALARRHGGVSLRLGGIYGPGRDRMVRAVVSGTARRPRAPQYGNRIHRDDAAAAIEHLLDLPSPDAAYVGVDLDGADLATVYAWVADALGLPAPPWADEASTTPHKRATSARLRASGWAPSYPSFREGYAEAIEEARRAIAARAAERGEAPHR